MRDKKNRVNDTRNTLHNQFSIIYNYIFFHGLGKKLQSDDFLTNSIFGVLRETPPNVADFSIS